VVGSDVKVLKVSFPHGADQGPFITGRRGQKDAKMQKAQSHSQAARAQDFSSAFVLLSVGFYSCPSRRVVKCDSQGAHPTMDS
jgi:hypothetical protein